MLKGLTSTFRNNCNNIELTYKEYIVIEGQTIPVRAKLSDDCYENGNFIGSFILKTIQFETSNDVKFRNKEFEYYKVVDGESIKIGTFITTEIEDNDTTELIKVVGMDYGLKTQVQYTSALDYESGNVTLMDVWNECCQLSGLESGVDEFENSNFIVDSDQFTGTGATIRDVFIGIALSSGSFIKVMNDDKIYPIFKTHTEDLLETTINTQGTIENVLEIDKIKELSGNTFQNTYTGKNLCGIPDQTVTKSGVTITIKDGEITINGTASAGITQYLTPKDTTTLNGNYSLNVIYISGSMSGSTNRNFNVRKASDNSNIFGVTFQTSNNYSTHNFTSSTQIIFGIYGANTTKFNNYKFRVQLVSGTSSDYDYEPYVGGTASPNPSYPQAIESVTGLQKITRCGKNLFDKNNVIDNYRLAPTGGGTPGNDYYVSSYIKVSPNTQYTKNSPTADAYHRYAFYENNNVDSFISVSNDNTITTPSNCKYIRFCGLKTEKDTTMLEVGNQVTEYKPYTGTTYEVNLGKNLIDLSQCINGYINSSGGISPGNNNLLSDYLEVESGKDYTISLNTQFQNIGYALFNSSKTYISRQNNNNKTTLTISIPSGIGYIRVWFTKESSYNLTPENILQFEPMIEKGSQVTLYSEYFTPIELNKTNDNVYQDSIKKSTGKNLFDETYENIDTTIVYKPIYVGNGIFTLSTTAPLNTSSSANLFFLSGNVNAGANTGSNGIYINRSIPQRSIDGYVTIAYRNSNGVDPRNYATQLELGNSATSYEPYLPKGTWYLEKQTRKLELAIADMNNSENYPGWLNQTQLKQDYLNVNDSAFNIGMKYYSNICEQPNEANDYIGINTTGTGLIFLRRNKFGNDYTQTYWKTNYPNLVFTMVYNLKTPEITEITNEELINQLESIELMKGTNNITITSENLTGGLKLSYWNDNSEIVEDYTELEDKRDTRPISCVRLGMSQIEGENVDMIDEDLVEQYGENWLILNDNPFAYNQEKRQQLITAIFNKVKGFGYSAFVSKTSFKPYMTCGDTLKFRNRNGDLVDSILLRYSHDYKEDDMEIQLEAPSETSATVNYVYPLSAIDMNKRTQVEVDKDKVQITNLTAQTTTIQDNLSNNYYTKDEANTLVQTAQTGLTNTFSEAGGNNIFRNTGLWFEQNDQNNPFEFWNGNVVKAKEEKASNYSALLLQNSTLSQEQLVPNGNYTISFKYKKLVQLAEVKCIINDIEIELDSLTDKEVMQVLEVNTQHINIQFVSDTTNSCEIYDLMVNAGSVKLAYSQNQNETTTDTVNISKGITITSSDVDVTFKANADGIRTLDRSGNRKTEFTDTGMITTRATIEEEAEIVGLLHKKVGNHIWVNKI